MPNLTPDEVIILTVPLPSTPQPSTITEPEWTAMDARVTAAEAAKALGDATDVDTTGAAGGEVLTFDDDTDTWGPAPITAALTFADTGSVTLTETAGEVTADVVFGGTGSASTAARSDHSHSAPIGKRATFAATGVLSSGTRALVSTTFGPLTNGITYDIEAWFLVRARNNVNSGTFNLLCRVGSSGSYPQLSRNVQTVGGVPVDQHIDFGDASGDMVLAGTGTTVAISFSAQFSTGDAVDLRDGFYKVQARPRR